MTLFAYGFRTFFLAAGIYASLVVPATVTLHFGVLPVSGVWPIGPWHAHEMIFGYGVAVLAGFLLTAVPGWQKTAPVAGARLAALAAVWLAGRAAMWAEPALPAWLVTAADLAFLPLLVVVGLSALWSARARRNRVFLLILAVLVAANALSHAGVRGYVDPRVGIALGLDVFLLLIAVVGGRVVPAFTTNALAAAGLRDAVHTRPALDRAAIALVALYGALHLASAFWPAVLPATGGVALAAAAANGARLSGWGWRHTLDRPIVWVLHLGYGWLVIALLAEGAEILGYAPAGFAAHAAGAGAVATMTIAIMTRAGLGHTGRVIVAAPAITAAYAALSLAAATRMAATLLDRPAVLVLIAALCWTYAFVAFVAVYGPVLTRPRPDGRPG